MMLDDIRFAWRSLLRRPLFTIVAVLTLALPIAANTSVFSVAKAVLIDRLPYRDADELVQLWGRWGYMDMNRNPWSFDELGDLIEQVDGFSGIAAYRGANPTLTGGDVARRLDGAEVSPNMFDVLGVAPVLGRTFGPDDGKARRVVISHGAQRPRNNRDLWSLGVATTA